MTPLPWHLEAAKEITEKQQPNGHVPHCPVCQLTMEEIVAIIVKHAPGVPQRFLEHDERLLAENTRLSFRVEAMRQENAALRSQVEALQTAMAERDRLWWKGEDDNNRLRAQVEALRNDLDLQHGNLIMSVSAARDLVTANKAIRAVLEKYGWHMNSCAIWADNSANDKSCTCGYVALASSKEGA